MIRVKVRLWFYVVSTEKSYGINGKFTDVHFLLLCSILYILECLVMVA